MHDLLSVEFALERVLNRARPLDPVLVELEEAGGMVLAADLIAPSAVPPHDNSALDGYAVRAADIAAAGQRSPARLAVIYEQPAGAANTTPIGPGEAVRIMTGAPLPPGADAVVGFEDTDRQDWGQNSGARNTPSEDAAVAVLAPAAPGEAIRRAGEDLQSGQLALPSGTVINPGAVGVAASIGVTKVLVHRRPRVAIIPTGDEVVEIDASPGPRPDPQPTTPGRWPNRCASTGVCPIAGRSSATR